MKVKVKEINAQNNSVLLEDEHSTESWFTLQEQVKIQYVGLGDAEATIDMKLNQVSYLKMNKAVPKAGGFQKKTTGFGSQVPVERPGESQTQEKKFYKTKHVVLEGLTGEKLRIALDAASDTNWVIATQTHFVDGKWYAVVYIKYKDA